MMLLCTRLASKGVLISLVVTKEWLGFLTSAQEPPPNVRLLSIPNVLPSEVSRAADVTGFMEAVHTNMEEPADHRLLSSIETVSLIIADMFISWAADVAWRRGIPVALLYPMAATVFSCSCHSTSWFVRDILPLA
ncbi:hypothetical protein AMTR_s00002p00256070 [Amborella trichopoda]|uniref:UDP-glycosyltransferases domain-containing protein n=1 Tax=Amborella trichopoda TaxID=13333 RepID=W1P106_AMBTC|nr:hypothetical protein AMTR_s00002p00256070 [Amborella trichopoda]